MKQMKNKQKGITLVALLITIIILLILAGITINSLTGSGLFDKVKLAKEKSENAEKLENETLEEYEKGIGKYIDGTRNNFQSTVWYPDESKGEVTTISPNQRIVIPNPYPGKRLYLTAQICLNGVWGDPGFVYALNYGGFGVKATQRLGDNIDEIIVRSGSNALWRGGSEGGDCFTDEELNTYSKYRFS